MARRYKRADLESPFLKLLLYGQPGSTKTRTAATAAWHELTSPCLMLEASGNPVSIRDYEQLPDIVHIDKLDDFNPIYDWLKAGQPSNHDVCRLLELNPPYKSLVVDSITEVQRMSFGTVIGTTTTGPGSIPATAEIQHFNRVLGQMVTFARLFFGLPLHVIITSLEREDKDESTGSIMCKPFLWGQSAGELAGYAYAVGRLVHRATLSARVKMDIEKDTFIAEDPLKNDTVAVALWRPTGKYVAKDQYGSLGPFMMDPTIPKILDRIMAGNQTQP